MKWSSRSVSRMSWAMTGRVETHPVEHLDEKSDRVDSEILGEVVGGVGQAETRKVDGELGDPCR